VPVLLVAELSEHGQSWMMRGLPLAAMCIRVLPLTTLNDESALRSLFESLSAAGRGSKKSGNAVAAVMIEPVNAQTGTCLATSTLIMLRGVCDDYGAALVCDETRNGLGRCGELLCAPSVGLRADVITLGESLGAGYASVSAVIYDRAVFKAIGAFPSTATMANDNLGSHVALAVLKELRATAADVAAAARTVEATLREALTACDSAYELRGRGLLLAVQFTPRALARLSTAAASVAEGVPPCLLLHSYLLNAHGVRTRPSGADSSTLMLDVPAVATSESVQRVADALRTVGQLLSRGACQRVLDFW